MSDIGGTGDVHEVPGTSRREIIPLQVFASDLRADRLDGGDHAAKTSEGTGDVPGAKQTLSDATYTEWEKFDPSYNLHNYGGRASCLGCRELVPGEDGTLTRERDGRITLKDGGKMVFENGAEWPLTPGMTAVLESYGVVTISHEGPFPLAEDRELTQMRYIALHELGVEPGSLTTIRIDGGGPKPATALEWVPFLKPNGQILHRDFAPLNTAYMEALLRGDTNFTFTNALGVEVVIGLREPWGAFADLVWDVGHMVFDDYPAFLYLSQGVDLTTSIHLGGIGDEWEGGQHPNGRAAWVADFVIDSITPNPQEAAQIFRGVIEKLRPGDVFSFHGMQNEAASESGEGTSYPAGAGTNFPNVAWREEDYRRIFDRLSNDFNIRFIVNSTTPAEGQAREGYHGMLNITGIVV